MNLTMYSRKSLILETIITCYHYTIMVIISNNNYMCSFINCIYIDTVDKKLLQVIVIYYHKNDSN